MKKIYFKNLYGLRFIAALIVMSYHFYGDSVIHGHYGVVLFFVLSGFLITFLLFEEKKELKKIKIFNFYMRRVLRIWPLYFLILIISVVLYIYSNKSLNIINTVPFYLFFLPNVAFALNITINKYSSILWSVGSEEQFYLLWPILVNSFSRKRFLKLNLFFIAFFTFGPNIIDFFNHNILNDSEIIIKISKIINKTGFNCIATGAVFAYIYKYKKPVVNFIFKIQIMNFILIIFLLIFNTKTFLFKGIDDQVYAFLFGILILNLGINNQSIFNLENKILNYLGKISFGIYMYHLIMIDLTQFIMLQFEINRHIIFLISLFLTLFVSGISYKYFEKPFLKIKNNKFSNSILSS